MSSKVVKYYFSCPRCGSADHFSKTAEESSGFGGLIFVTGGILSSLLVAERNRNRIQCEACRYLFQQPRLPSTPFATKARWLSFLGIILSLVIFFQFPGARLTRSLWLAPLDAAGLFFLLTVIPLWISALISNWRYEMEVAARYLIHPGFPRSANPVTRN